MQIKLINKASTKTSRGILSKAWYWIDGKICLVKGNSLNAKGHIGYEPYSEVIASEIASVLNFDHITYKLMDASYFPEVEVTGIKVVSVCENYTIKGFERYPLDRYIISKLGYEPDNPDDYLTAYLTHLPALPLYQMLLFDAFIGNPDRHIRNIDIFTNGKESKLAPIYDNGASLLAWVSPSDLGKARNEFSFDESKPFRSKHATQMKLLKLSLIQRQDPQGLYLEILNRMEPITSLLPSERKRAIENYLLNRMKYLEGGMK